MRVTIGGGILLFIFYRITTILQLQYGWGFLFFIVIIYYNSFPSNEKYLEPTSLPFSNLIILLTCPLEL